MRIVYHHRTQGQGVEAVHILGIVNAWRKFGYDVKIFSPPGVSFDNGNSTKKPRGLLSNMLRLLSRIVPEIVFEIMEVCYNFFVSNKFSLTLDEKPCDLIFERYAFFTWVGLRQAKKRSIPFFLEVNFTSHTPLHRRRSRLLGPLQLMVERYLFEGATGLVAVSTYLKNHLIEFGVAPEKIIILPNAADPEIFIPEESDESITKKMNLEGKRVVGFVGYFYPWHSVELLIRAAAFVKESVKDVAFVLIGDGPTRKQVEEDVHKRGIDNDVIFTGKVDHKLLPAYISIFDVAVMPHSNDYGSPMKIFEYMAMGKPVVGPDIGPLRDGLRSGSEGVLFEPGSERSLADALVKVLTNDELRATMSARARQRVETERNWSYNASEIINLYLDRVKSGA